MGDYSIRSLNEIRSNRLDGESDEEVLMRMTKETGRICVPNTFIRSLGWNGKGVFDAVAMQCVDEGI